MTYWITWGGAQVVKGINYVHLWALHVEAEMKNQHHLIAHKGVERWKWTL